VTRSPAAPLAKVVLITGCSSGIGAATARRLARAGWTVYATARRLEALAPLAQEGCRTLALDVTDEASMRAAVSAIEAEHGAIDALVNNAGYSQSGAIESVPIDRIRRQFETNVIGLVRLTQCVLPGMRRQRAGRIVNLGSMGGRLVFPGGGIYHATKYAIEALSDALRFEVRGFGIQVVLIEPGFIRTGFSGTVEAGLAGVESQAYDAFHARVIQATRDAYARGLAAKLSSPPERVADVIAQALTSPHPRARYLVSPSAHLFVRLRRLLGDRGWDAFLRRVYPSPK
jgi:NAD(P)-dependent dehydrogenase (short-subunit alcohol dehydrogenase family)